MSLVCPSVFPLYSPPYFPSISFAVCLFCVYSLSVCSSFVYLFPRIFSFICLSSRYLFPVYFSSICPSSIFPLLNILPPYIFPPYVPLLYILRYVPCISFLHMFFLCISLFYMSVCPSVYPSYVSFP